MMAQTTTRSNRKSEPPLAVMRPLMLTKPFFPWAVGKIRISVACEGGVWIALCPL